jgi:hypothetical protein
MELDRKAVRILTETYWSSAGWKRNPETPAEDFAYAKRHGVMFDPIVLLHDQAIKAAIDAVSAVSKDTVVAAFLASLSSRRLGLRSALGTYAVGRHMEQHNFKNNGSMQACAYCGDYDSSRSVDLNVLNFERMKWGGTRHDHPSYIAFDLQTFENLPNAIPTDEDVDILRLILDIAGSMPAKARPNHLDKALAKVLPSNSSERRTLIAILGFAGVLVDPSRPNFRTQFVPIEQRERTPWHTDDWPYPAMWWTGSHGVNQSAVNEWFAFL